MWIGMSEPALSGRKISSVSPKPIPVGDVGLHGDSAPRCKAASSDIANDRVEICDMVTNAERIGGHRFLPQKLVAMYLASMNSAIP